MLILSRPEDGRIQIADDIAITVLRIRGNQVQLGLEAPASVNIVREEAIAEPPPQAPERQE